MRLLLVEDARDVADPIVASFVRAGDTMDLAPTLALARDCLGARRFDVVMLDIDLPDGSGRTLLAELRGAHDPTPVLMLTASLGIEERVASLDGGADDYLTKPFDLRELHARVRALRRRGRVAPEAGTDVGDLHVDVPGKCASLDGRDLGLTHREFGLFEMLLARRGRVVSKERLLEGLFALEDEDVGINAIELYVSRLRRRLAGSRVSIRTLRGLGYQLVEED